MGICLQVCLVPRKSGEGWMDCLELLTTKLSMQRPYYYFIPNSSFKDISFLALILKVSFLLNRIWKQSLLKETSCIVTVFTNWQSEFNPLYSSQRKKKTKCPLKATHKLTNLSYRLKTTAVYSSGLNFLSSMPKVLSLISSARYTLCCIFHQNSFCRMWQNMSLTWVRDLNRQIWVWGQLGLT